MMKEKLNNIVSIRLGYAFRGKIQTNPDGNLYVIQPKDLSDFNPVKILSHKINTSHLLKKSDILLSNRGKFRAFIFNDPKVTIASSGFFVLRIKKKDIFPEYLALFLNSSFGQQVIASKQEIMTIPALTRKQVEEIEIPIISFDKQQKLASFVKLQQKEHTLIQHLAKLKEQRLNHIIKGAINA